MNGNATHCTNIDNPAAAKAYVPKHADTTTTGIVREMNRDSLRFASRSEVATYIGKHCTDDVFIERVLERIHPQVDALVAARKAGRAA